MGGLTSRNKGKRGEREVVKLLQPVIDKVYSEIGGEPPVLERNLMQSHKGGFDIVGLEWLALEVKFQEQIKINDWWLQTKSQAKEEQEPVLFYRKSRMAWRVMMFGILEAGERRVRCPVDIPFETFLIYFEINLKERLIK